MKRFFLLFWSSLIVISAVLEPVVVYAQISAEDAIATVVKFEELFWGKSIEFDPKFDEAPEHNQRIRLSISEDGQYSNVFWDFEVAKIKSESCSLSNGQLIKAFTSVGGDKTSLQGVLETKYSAVTTVVFAPYLVGISLDDGLRYSDIILDPQSTVTVERSELEGEECTKLVAQNKTFGEYCFWISQIENERRVLKIAVKKTTGNSLFLSPFHEMSTIGSVPQVGVGKDEQEQKKLQAEAEKAPREVLTEKILFPIVYQKGLPQRMGVLFRSEFQNKAMIEGSCSLEVNSIRPFRYTSTDRAKFQNLSVDNGVSVSVVGQDGIAYAFNNGKIERVIDTASIGRVNGVRFRKPDSNWNYYAVFLLGLSVFVFIFLYYRQRVKK